MRSLSSTGPGRSLEGTMSATKSSRSTFATPKSSTMGRPSWDEKHNLTFSMINPEMRWNEREYFDKPLPKDNKAWDDIPKPRQQYCMNDRQLGWADEPAPLGEPRRTYLDHAEPTDGIGGCHKKQLPSYWRKVHNWQAFSVPDLHAHKSISPRKAPSLASLKDGSCDQRSLLQELADTPAGEATTFWRGWAAAQEARKAGVSEKPPGVRDSWDDRWNVTWSKDNDTWCSRQREYFSVPLGNLGRATGPPGPSAVATLRR